MTSNLYVILCYMICQLSWYEALIDCKRQGLRLATVESQKEQEEVIKTIKLQDLPTYKQAFFWLSGSDLGKENDYVWMTSGQPLSYTAWYSDAYIFNEPNHLPNSLTPWRRRERQHCISLRSDYGYEWNDDFCSSKYYYVCDNQA